MTGKCGETSDYLGPTNPKKQNDGEFGGEFLRLSFCLVYSQLVIEVAYNLEL
jgi:hypothetical protein